MFEKLPLYAACIDDVDDGIYTISLVSDPATQVQWQCFSKEQHVEFTIDNEEQHIIASVVMLADTPIYRRNADGYEYNIIYHKDTIKTMAEKMLFDNTHNNIDIQHNGILLDKGKVQLVELFIKDEANGISPTYLDVPDGSLIAKYKIHDEELWNQCKNGSLNGISLAGCFNVENEKFNNVKNLSKHKNMLKRIKDTLMSLLLQYSEVKTDNGILYYEGEELTEGLVVTDENEEPVEDGVYTLEDGTKVTIENSTVKSIEAPAEEDEEVVEENNKEEEQPENAEESTEEPEENKDPESEETEEPEEKEEKEELEENEEISALKAEIELLKAEIESIKETIKIISEAPAAEPVAEEFKNITSSNADKYSRIGAYLK